MIPLLALSVLSYPQRMSAPGAENAAPSPPCARATVFKAALRIFPAESVRVVGPLPAVSTPVVVMAPPKLMAPTIRLPLMSTCHRAEPAALRSFISEPVGDESVARLPKIISSLFWF